MERYYRYAEYLKKKYGEKVYKLPVNLQVSCPNRDGTLGKDGCYFCGEEAAGFENLPAAMSVREQLEKNKAYIGKRYGAKKFIAFFQNFSNTYLPLEQLLSYVTEALSVEDLVEIALSTRPDCISEEYITALLALLAEKKPSVGLSFEYGLQTVNYHTLHEVNRGHTLGEFINAVLLSKKYNLGVSAHLILNLPGDERVDAVENAKVLSALGVDTVKLHALYIREGTVFARKYQEGELQMIPLAEYVERVILFLEHLNPEIAIQRLLGRAPEAGALFVNWDRSWWKIHDLIVAEMERRNTFQGKRFTYLNGKALHRFA